MPDATMIDPLGRSIILYDRAWYGHIARNHPEVKRLRHLVEDAIRSPYTIAFSTSDPDCRIYDGPGPRTGVMIRVVADVVLGLVKTAYLCRKVGGGTVEWSSPTP